MQRTSGQVTETSLAADINYNGQPSVLVPISSSVYKVACTYLCGTQWYNNKSHCLHLLSYFAHCTWTYEGESNENRKNFFKFNLLNESGTQLYHFST
jgi:hypothetical protein